VICRVVDGAGGSWRRGKQNSRFYILYFYYYQGGIVAPTKILFPTSHESSFQRDFLKWWAFPLTHRQLVLHGQILHASHD